MAKSKQPAFRADYVAKLKELGVYDQFVKNWQNDTPRPSSVSSMNKRETFSDFVYSAFFWFETPEREDFWLKIANS